MQADIDPSTPSSPRYDQAYEAIRGMIVAGRLRGGDIVSEVRLADDLAISRTPVREAVRRLVGQGLVESTPRGLRVFRPRPEDVAEVYFLRAAIEGALIRAACIRVTPGEIEALRAVHANSLDANARDDIASMVALNGEFHGKIAAAAGSGRAASTLHGLDPLVATYRRLSLLAPGHRDSSHSEHERLIGLLERRDGERAEALMRAHIARAGRRITEAALHIEPPMDAADGPAAPFANLDSLDTPDDAL